MRVVACITQTSVIDQILAHRRTRAARAAHAGPRSPRRRGPPPAGARHAPRPSADAPTAPLSTAPPPRRPAAPPPRGDLWRGRQSHRRVRSVPAGIAPPTGTAVLTAHQARERGGGHAAAQLSVLARSAIASDARRIVDPPRLKFLSRPHTCAPSSSTHTPHGPTAYHPRRLSNPLRSICACSTACWHARLRPKPRSGSGGRPCAGRTCMRGSRPHAPTLGRRVLPPALLPCIGPRRHVLT